MDAIKDRSSEFYKAIATNFSRKLRIQEEIVSLELLSEELNWMVGERISLLETELVTLANDEISNEEILSTELTMEVDELLEITLCEMRNHTKIFEKDRNLQLKLLKKDLVQRLREFQDQIDSHEEEAQLAELELEKFSNARLQEHFFTRTIP